MRGAGRGFVPRGQPLRASSPRPCRSVRSAETAAASRRLLRKPARRSAVCRRPSRLCARHRRTARPRNVASRNVASQKCRVRNVLRNFLSVLGAAPRRRRRHRRRPDQRALLVLPREPQPLPDGRRRTPSQPAALFLCRRLLPHSQLRPFSARCPWFLAPTRPRHSLRGVSDRATARPPVRRS